MIRAVIFDLGGVVCAFHPERRLRALSEVSRLPEREIHARIWDSGLDRALDTGVHDGASAHRAVCDALGVDLAPDRLTVSWAHAFVPDPSRAALYADLFGDFLAVRESSAAAWPRLAAMRGREGTGS